MENSTKLQEILSQKEMSQADLIKIIKDKTGMEFDKGNLSRIVNGVKTNFTIETARIISDALDVTIDDIID
jgi:DNA-binding Xre family transcriptional regulator